MHSVFHQNCSSYLCDLVQFVNDDPTKRRLRSASTRTAATVCARTKLGDRAFSVTAPSTWNSLPSYYVTSTPTYPQFRRHLKHICSIRLLTLSCFICISMFSADVLIVFGRPLGLGLCHRKSVRPSVRLSVTLVYCGQTA